MLRNIIWDVDGTLFDTYPAIAQSFRAALNDRGQDAPLEQITGLARKSLGHCVAALAGDHHLKEADLGQAFAAHYNRVLPEQQPPFPGVTDLCEYICSMGGKNVIVTHRGQAGAAELLAAHHMAHYFSGCLSRDDGYPKKPDPAAFEAMLTMYCLNREETLAVGDRAIDILAGQAAGLFTCLFGDEDEEAVADLTISRFEELYRHIVSTGR